MFLNFPMWTNCFSPFLQKVSLFYKNLNGEDAANGTTHGHVAAIKMSYNILQKKKNIMRRVSYSKWNTNDFKNF